ncbi:DJ-1/PfpI family protein [Coprinopsis sp. MPI-PUGE-AT-0042]|nr:DJ-1/PfpI family protein [Coprinopsis sp. MPI-PUGE-AT-0042]
MQILTTLLALPLLAAVQIPNPPTKFGVLLFPAYTALDVYGPLEVLTQMSYKRENMTLSMISRSLNPVTTIAHDKNHTFGSSVIITHTFSSPPPDLEVLIVPGGIGTRGPELEPEVNFIRDTFPSLRYLISVCTGNGLVARSGILDGKKATGNKAAWAWVTAQSKKVHWIGKARWVVSSEKIWSTSGDVAKSLENGAEWSRVTDPNADEFADIHNTTDVLPTE